MFRSKLEENVADILFENEVAFDYEEDKISYVLEKNYIPDFKLPNGIYLEAKGLWDSADRRKILAVIKQNPKIDLRMIFQNPYQKISKKSKTTYAKYCDRHGIKWCPSYLIPVDWFQ